MKTPAAPRRHLAIVVGILVAWSAWYAAGRAGLPAGPAAIAYLALPLGAAVAAHAVAGLIRSVPLDPVARRFWRLMLVSFALLAAGYAILAAAAFRNTGVLPDMPIPGAVVAASAFLVAMWAVARVPLGIAGGPQRWRQWLDRAIAFDGCATVLFNFGLAPMIRASERWTVVVYQPIVELAGGRVVGVEALVRWQHPTRGLVSPADFIPAAEGTGLIVPLGRFVLREACRQTAAWLAEFGPDALQKIAPNVSARQLHDPDFVAGVREVLADAGLPADRLVLELTESAVLRGQQVSRALHELHDMGVRLALDDFGTGESSLSLLRAFPASIVKLDKSFVDGIELAADGTPEASARQAVARAVVQLAGALGLDTVAEGIENQAQADRLRALGYTLGQGYHLARPMPAEDFTRLLAAQRDLAAA